MDGRRSYLDSLNVGRQRRAQNPLDELSRSLERLGERLERRDERPPHAPSRERHPAGRRVFRDEPAPQPPRNDAYLATTGRLAAEVKGLRDELRQQMTSGLRQQFDELRSELARAYGAGGDAKSSRQLASELERLSESIEMLPARSDDRSINLLRLDIEQLRAELETLAREETVRSIDSRWDQLDRRWHDLEQRIDTRVAPDPALAALNERLQQITDAVNSLPESLSLSALEERVRGLAGSVERFAGRQDDRSPEFFAAIEQRLDEISRAIVASASAAQPSALDYDMVERIEGRISSLARQLDDLAHRGPETEILDRLNLLSARIEEVAQQADVPARSVERLAGQIAVIVDKLDAGSALPDADEIMRGLEARFDQFASQVERRQDDALEASQAMFRDLEARLYDVVSRLETRPEPAADTSGIMDAIDARFADLSRRLERRETDGLDTAAVRELEARIDTISDRIDRSPAAPAIDAEAIRNLESQVAGLSALLASPGAQGADAIGPRLDGMERAIRENRDAVIEAARQAAEDVVRSFAGQGADNAAVAGLAQDLKTLEAITRRSDDRNSKTFEAIHDTLLKIVDRLGTIEGAAAPAKLAIKDAPPIQPDDVLPVDAVAPRRRGSEAAAEAALAEAESEIPAPVAEAAPEGGRRRSMLSGLTRAFAGRRGEPVQAEAAAPVVEPEAPKLDLDEPLDPKAMNRPLQPGSGAPDLSRILKRVREERAQQPAKPEDADAAKSDFIAAARRAAQAAAAEAEVLKRHSEIGGTSSGFKLGELLKARRKPILMGAVAVMIALAGLQLGKAFLSDRSPEVESAGLATLPTGETDGEEQAALADASGTTAVETQAAASDAAPDQPVSAMSAEAPAADQPATPVLAEDRAAAAAAPQDAGVAPEPVMTASVGAPAAALPGETPVAAPVQVPADAGPVALREAAEAGDPKAMFEIGARYSEGRGTKADDAKAAEWYERAAELGLAPAQYRIGNMYEKGVGVERDLNRAKTWYQMAAEQGNASAMHNLAVLFAMGADGTTDNESAARWFARAAELGVKDSQFNMGILTAKGVGMPQNLEESYKWFALVAKGGDRDAAAKRDEVANSLRPEQLERARATTELWKAKEVDAAANVVDIPEAWQEGAETTAGVDMTKAVKTIQLILNKNGYDAGGADGIMGQKTKDAIVAFQKDNGLAADGKVTEDLVRELLARK